MSTSTRHKKLDSKPRPTPPPLRRQKPKSSYTMYFIAGSSVAIALFAMFWIYKDWFIMPSASTSPSTTNITPLYTAMRPAEQQFDVINGGLINTFEIRHIPGKGKGLIAIRDIKRGEMIIREAPLLTIPRNIDIPPTEAIGSVLLNLTPEAKERLLELSYVKAPRNPSENATALAIVATNGVSVGTDIGVFPTTARMNHGCSSAFNAVYVWRAKDGVIVVHAIKDIKKDEEILTAYMDTKQTRQNRRFYLKHAYDFDCECAVCSLAEEESKASDERLTRITSLYHEFTTWESNRINGSEAIDIIREIWFLGEKEAHVSGRGRLANDAVVVAAAHSDDGAARAWAAVAVNWYASELGDEATFVKECEIFARDPTRHQAWGSRENMRVGGPEGLEGVTAVTSDPSLPWRT